MAKVYSVVLTLFYLGFLRVARLEGGEGVGAGAESARDPLL